MSVSSSFSKSSWNILQLEHIVVEKIKLKEQIQQLIK